MSVATQIERIKTNIASAYAKAAEKGAELPEVQNSENLPDVIEAIPTDGLPDDVYTITVDSSDSEMGSVSGGGFVSAGMTASVTVSAVPNTGYDFQEWRENGEQVSMAQKFTFPVSGSRNLVGAFSIRQYAAGVDWWESTLPSSARWLSVAYGDGKFVAVTNGDKAAYSTNGINWTAATLPSSAYWISVTYGNGRFVAVASNNSDKVTYSSALGPGK